MAKANGQPNRAPRLPPQITGRVQSSGQKSLPSLHPPFSERKPNDVDQLWGWTNGLRQWIDSVPEPNAWAGIVFRPAREMTLAMMRLSVTQPFVIEQIKAALQHCENDFAAWREDHDGELWTEFARSVDRLSDLLDEGVRILDGAYLVPDAVAISAAGIVADDQMPKASTPEKTSGAFAAPGTKVPVNFREPRQENGFECGPLRGTAPAIMRAMNPRMKWARREQLVALRDKGAVFVRETGINKTVDVYFTGMIEYERLKSKHPELVPPGLAPRQ